MTTTVSRTPRAAGLGAVFATALAAAVVFAPNAHAYSTPVFVAGDDHRVGCSYRGGASIPGLSSGFAGSTVHFYDDGVLIGTGAVPSFAGDTTTTWWPATAGAHQLTALLGTSIPQWLIPATVTVDPSTGTGSAACGLPSFSG
ncbi:hypothetical protein ACFWU5_12095 [Nocardia sp. NPDC058640]|uniref:hypothetical protein n=1 Tax=Nocardia sp. NPDC058640 TaxID=3346571 RepID=UPI003665F0F8